MTFQNDNHSKIKTSVGIDYMTIRMLSMSPPHSYTFYEKSRSKTDPHRTYNKASNDTDTENSVSKIQQTRRSSNSCPKGLLSSIYYSDLIKDLPANNTGGGKFLTPSADKINRDKIKDGSGISLDNEQDNILDKSYSYDPFSTHSPDFSAVISSPLNQRRRSSGNNNNRTILTSPEKASEEVVKAEKGWISHTDKGYTHNIVLNKARALAIAARMVYFLLIPILQPYLSL
jgi:hypothetical protein